MTTTISHAKPSEALAKEGCKRSGMNKWRRGHQPREAPATNIEIREADGPTSTLDPQPHETFAS